MFLKLIPFKIIFYIYCNKKPFGKVSLKDFINNPEGHTGYCKPSILEYGVYIILVNPIHTALRINCTYFSYRFGLNLI